MAAREKSECCEAHEESRERKKCKGDKLHRSRTGQGEEKEDRDRRRITRREKGS